MKSSGEACCKNIQCDGSTTDTTALDKASKTQTANGECSKSSFANMIVKPASEGIRAVVLLLVYLYYFCTNTWNLWIKSSSCCFRVALLR